MMVTPVMRAVIMGGLCIGAEIRMKRGKATKNICPCVSCLSSILQCPLRESTARRFGLR